MNLLPQFTLGIIVNPYAGIGGSVALKGSDGDDIRNEALARGAPLRAEPRMQRCLQLLQAYAEQIHIYCFAGDMGEHLAHNLQLNYSVIGGAKTQPSSADDTMQAAKMLAAMPVDLILFAGGDGTARNMADALACVNAKKQAVLGVPSGVKMHSGVYAITPEAAAEIVLGLLQKQIVNIEECAVKDIDEIAFREGKVKTRFYGSLYVPVLSKFLQQVKNSGAAQDELVKLDIANSLIENLEENTLYIVGPGSTTHVFLQEMGLQGTLLGVDVLFNKTLIAVDASANGILELLKQHVGKVSIILTAIGGQGHIIGRGNQQLTPDILRRVGRQHIHIIATKDKILSLQGRPLLVDSNDPELDKEFSGYQSVLVGYNEFILYPIGI